MSKKKLIPTDGKGNARDLPKLPVYKAKQKPYIEPQWLRDYRLARDRLIYAISTPDRKLEIIQQVKEMKLEWNKQDKRKNT